MCTNPVCKTFDSVLTCFNILWFPHISFANRNVISPLEGVDVQTVRATRRRKKTEQRNTVSTEMCGIFREKKSWQLKVPPFHLE